MALLPWIIGAVVVVVLLLFFGLWAFNYRNVGPNQVLVISGRTSTVTERDGTQRTVGYRLQVGGGTFVMPLVETVDTLPLEVFSISVRCPEVLTAQGVMISAEAFGQVKASSDATLLPRAVENFLSKGSAGITSVAQEVLEGHMRAAWPVPRSSTPRSTSVRRNATGAGSARSACGSAARGSGSPPAPTAAARRWTGGRTPAAASVA